MKRAAKILKVAFLFLLSVFIILFAVSLLMQDKVGSLLLKTLNNNFSTRIETGSYRLSLIKNFPKASVELRNVVVYSSANFDRKAFSGFNTDTLLKAKSASIDFKTADMIRGMYTFTKITVKSGVLNVFTDSSGHYNYDVSKTQGNRTQSENVTLNFERINFSDLKFLYNDLRVDLILRGRFKNGTAKTNFKNEKIDFDGSAKTVFELFRLGDISIRQSIPANLYVSLNRNEKGYFFRKCIMEIENWKFALNGIITADYYQDLDITSDNIDISRIYNLLPEKYKKIASEFHPTGNLRFDWKIKGKSYRSQDPHYEIAFSLSDAKVNSGRSKLRIDKFSFDGVYNNGSGNRPETSIFNIRNFSARLGSSDYKGSFSYSNFTNPHAELALKGRLLPDELREFLGIKNISKASGSIDFDIEFSGNPGKKASYSFLDVFSLHSQSEVRFNSVGISLSDQKLNISDANGRVIIKEKTETDDFRFTINRQKMNIRGSLSDFPGWLAGNPVDLKGTLTVTASSLRPELFMQSDNIKQAEKNEVSQKASVTFPDNVNLDVNFSIDTLVYKTFDARKITGILSVSPKILNFRTVSLLSQNGSISGNTVVVQKSDKSFLGRGSFTVKDVDVNRSFTTFHNFGQNFLKAENIAGSLSGNISLVLPVDSLLKPDIKSISAEGRYLITNGALINFDPVKALSRFIELSELENIKFEKLENDFLIRNNIFYVPQMDIKSSAADLSVNGRHSFENEYQYHVKMLLSEILSNKARKNRKTSDEFGEVEDDGLGRTSIFLKLDGVGENVKVSYDMKAAQNQIKEDVKKEKQALKTIFNEEYGLYKGDSALTKKETPKKKFRIVWEGSDSTSIEKELPVEKKESILKKIFKKK